MSILEDSINVIKLNWNIEIKPAVEEVFNIDSSDMQPQNWTMLIEKIEEKYDDFDAFIILHGTNTM
jgi:L-asparaginase